jgi:hypothetical protein
MGPTGATLRASLERAARCDQPARWGLLDRHLARLRRMVEVRIDSSLTPRIDPSDVIQESPATAAACLRPSRPQVSLGSPAEITHLARDHRCFTTPAFVCGCRLSPALR